MKKTLLLIVLFFSPILIKAQITKKISPDKGFYIGLQYGSQTNYGDFKTDNPTYFKKSNDIELSGSTIDFHVGYKTGKHKFEIFTKNLSQFNSVAYSFPDTLNQIRSGGAGTGRSIAYYGFRYYNNILKLNKRFDIDAGIGVGLALLDYTGPDGFSAHCQDLVSIIDGKTLAVIQCYKETVYHAKTIVFEGNLKLNYHFNPRWSATLSGQYLWNPEYIRANQWTFAYDNGKTYSGYTKTNLSSVVVSIGLQYNFMKRATFEELAGEKKTRTPRQIESDNRFRHFYVGFDIGVFTNNGDLKSSVNYGTITPYYWAARSRIIYPIKFGYRFNEKHSVEVSYQKFRQYLTFSYGTLGETNGLITFPTARLDFGQPMTYFPIRYFYRFIEKTGWSLQGGVGLAYATFDYNQSNDFTSKSEFQQSLGSSSNPNIYSVDYVDFERTTNNRTFVIEGNLRVDKTLSNQWVLSLFGRYMYNPQYLRELKFTATYNNNIETKIGTATSNLSGAVWGLGIKRFF